MLRCTHPAEAWVLARASSRGSRGCSVWAPPKEQENSATYNRGVYQAAVHVEAIRQAIKAKGGAKPTGEDVRAGFEKIKAADLAGLGLAPPLALSPEDHEGGGWVQIWSVKGGKFVKTTEWQQAYRDVIKKHIEADGKK